MILDATAQAGHDSLCACCLGPIDEGDDIYTRPGGEWVHPECAEED